MLDQNVIACQLPAEPLLVTIAIILAFLFVAHKLVSLIGMAHVETHAHDDEHVNYILPRN